MISNTKNFASIYKNLLAFLFFVVLAIIAIGANPLADETVGPFDLLVSNPGYSSVAPAKLKIRSPERSDILDVSLPGWRKHKEEFHAGLTNIHKNKLDLIEKLYEMIWKPSLLFYTFIPNDPIAYYFSQLIKLIIAGFGTYLFLKLFLSFPASLFGGIVYMLCGFNAAWFFWAQEETSMWIPWLLWAVALYLVSDKTKYLFLITLISVFLIKGGFPPVAAYGLYSSALLIFVYNVFNRKKVSSFLLKSITPLLFIGLGFMISSDYLLRFVNFIKDVDLSYRQASNTGMVLKKLRNLYDPSEVHVESSIYSGFLAFVFSLFSFLYLWVKEKVKNWKSFYVYALVLMIISMVITFSLINPALIRKIPVISSSAWRRFSVIVSLSMALLSSFFIEFIYRLRKKPAKVFKLVIPFLIVFLAVQFVDQKNYFNEYNGSTLSKYFYPMTPSIKFAKNNIKDYQSIMADHSFKTSGTLSYYCFFEWYRHSFRTNTEKELLTSLAPRSHSTPTSFIIAPQNIKFLSPLMNIFAVKYIFISRKGLSFTKTPYFFKQASINHTPSPPLPINNLCQHFYISESRELEAVNLLLGNYRNDRFNSDVLLKLYDSQTNELIGVAKKEKKYIKDNTWVYFEFEEPVDLKKGGYKFSIEYANKRTRAMLSGWSTKKTEGINSYLTVNGERTDLSFKYSLHEPNDIYKETYKVHRLEPAVAVVENLKCPEGPYLISAIDEYPPVIKISDLKYESSIGELTIHLPKKSSGYVIIPRPKDNYIAYVDGELKDIDQYLGIMPAVYIDDNTKVIIKKKPFYLMTGFIISFLSLLFFVIFLFFMRKSRNF